jgi:MoaA/NifB/PqqE/SkfB family radical SAM enzyme
VTLPLVDQFAYGLDAPICLTWELTYACNLSCVHCLSSSGRRDPRELSTAECRAVIDELERMQVFYVNIGGEPTVRSDFWELVDYATAHHVGVKFSTNGVKITQEVSPAPRGERLRRRPDLTRRRDRRRQRRGARGRLVRHGAAGDAPPSRGGLPGIQDLRGGDQAERRPAR